MTRKGQWTITWEDETIADTTVAVEVWDFGRNPYVYTNGQALHFIWNEGNELLIPFTAIRVADYKAPE